MKTRTIGDITVSAIGFGGMPVSIEGRPDEAQAIAYRMPGENVSHNEQLIAKALKTYGGDTSNVLVATKGGHLREDPTPHEWQQNGHPDYLKRAAQASLKNLRVEAIGLYQFHRPDPEVDYADSVGAIRDLLDDGVIRMAGISNANPNQIHQAQEILGGRLVSVQNQFSPAFRSSEPELDLCDEIGIAFLPWSPLGGIGGAGNLGEKFGPFRAVADEHGVSPQVICLAWELAKSPIVIPIPGSTRPETITDSASASDIVLTSEQIAVLDAA
jgi:aryl-alcohol dehydrogenase-like predicted oxidoreductase